MLLYGWLLVASSFLHRVQNRIVFGSWPTWFPCLIHYTPESFRQSGVEFEYNVETRMIECDGARQKWGREGKVRR